MATQSNINKTKGEMNSANNKDQLHGIVQRFCIDMGFNLIEERDYAFNARKAVNQSKPGVAELLRHANAVQAKL